MRRTFHASGHAGRSNRPQIPFTSHIRDSPSLHVRPYGPTLTLTAGFRIDSVRRAQAAIMPAVADGEASGGPATSAASSSASGMAAGAGEIALPGRPAEAPSPPPAGAAAGAFGSASSAGVSTAEQQLQLQLQTFGSNRSAAAGALASTLSPAPSTAEQQQQLLQLQQQTLGSNRSTSGLNQRVAIKRTNTIGMDEAFVLHPASLQVPLHIWEHVGGHFTLPHHLPTLGKGEGVTEALRVGKRLRRLVHVPGLPMRRNWRFMKQHLLADLLAGLTCAVMLIPQGTSVLCVRYDSSLDPIAL